MIWRYLYTCMVVTVLATSGCGPSEQAPNLQMQRHTLEHDGLTREYFVFLPSGYDGAREMPAAIFMHGYGGTATGTEAEVTQGLNQYAEEYGFVMVYPQSTWFMADVDSEEPWEASTWNHISDAFDRGPDGPICEDDATKRPCPPECGDCGSCGWASCYDDAGFLRDLIDRVTEDLAVDADRFYVSGFSNGAQMANRLGCEASDKITAVALIGGRVEPGFECTPSRPLPLLQINGGNDETVPFDGRVSRSGYYYASTTSISKYWVDNNACANDTQPWTSAVVPAEEAQCTIACGDTAHPSIDCLWPEGDHRWPGTAGFRGSNGYCVTELQAPSMPDQLICIAPEDDTDFWGSHLLFEFFNAYGGES